MESQRSTETLRRLIPIKGLFVAVSVGYINSVYSDRFPQGTGVQFLKEVFIVGLSNPYALLDGFFASAFFWRITKIPGREESKTDYLMLVFAFLVVALGFLLQVGYIVY